MKRLTTYILLVLTFCHIGKAQPICNITEYGENDGLAQWHITQIVQDKQGMIWMSTWNGLNRFDGEEFHCFKSQPGDGCDMFTDRIRNIWIDDNGNIQCLVDNGCFEFNTKTYLFSKSDKAAESVINNISLIDKPQAEYTDIYGTRWIISRDGTLAYVDEKSNNIVCYQLDKNPKDIKFCFSDKQGNLWLLGSHNIYKLSFGTKPIELITEKDAGQIRSLLVDNKKRYWITNRDNNTVQLFDHNNKFLGYLGSDGLLHKKHTTFGASVYSMLQTTNGNIWLGCKPGKLFCLEETGNGSFSIRRIKNIGNSGIYDIKEDANGRLWIATLGHGVGCIVNPMADVPTVYTGSDGFDNYPQKAFNKCRNLLLTDSGRLLAATTDGLIIAKIGDDNSLRTTRFNTHVRNANRASSLSCNAIMHITTDQKGNIYICSESGGVNKIASNNLDGDTLSFRHYNTHSGLPTDVTLTATPNGDKLWITCSNSLILLNPTDGTHTAYDSRFFNTSSRFSDAQPVLLPDGRWLFATHDNAFAINPELIRKSNFIPQIALTSISIENGKKIMAANSLDTLYLSANERNATISFAALDYSYGANISYAFRLNDDSGEENTWNNIGHDRSVTLLDLMPGTYHLEIHSTNGDGIWSDNNRQLTIIVKPKWHETLLARIFFLLIALAAIGLIAYTIIYIRRINKRQHETLQAYLALMEQREQAPADIVQDNDNQPSEQLEPAASQPIVLTPEDDAFMRRVVAFVEENIGNADASIGDMADAAAVSRSGLQRKMKHLMGITPLDFLREARIKRACQLLEQSSKPVSDIAYECGFSDPKYFSRSFKSSTGKSPSDYRK